MGTIHLDLEVGLVCSLFSASGRGRWEIVMRDDVAGFVEAIAKEQDCCPIPNTVESARKFR